MFLKASITAHAYEAFTIALCFWSSSKISNQLLQQTFSVYSVFFCSLSIILTILTRPSDIQIFVLPIIICCIQLVSKKNVLINKKVLSTLIGYFFISLVICSIPLFYINIRLYGELYPSSYQIYGYKVINGLSTNSVHDLIFMLKLLADRLHQVFIIFYSFEFGIIYCSSILFFGLILIYYFMFKHLRFTHKVISSKSVKHQNFFVLKEGNKLIYFTLVILCFYISIPLSIVLIWQSFAQIYAYRFLFSLFPISLLGYVYWKNDIEQKYSNFYSCTLSIKSLQVIIILFCFFGLLSDIFFNINDNLELTQGNGVINSFGINVESYEYAAPEYVLSVLKSIPKRETWKSLLAVRGTGFAAKGIRDISKYNGLDQFIQVGNYTESLPYHIYFQAILLGFLFIGGYVLILNFR